MKNQKIILLCLLLSGCGGTFQQGVSIRPPTHPLLGAADWVHGTESHEPIQRLQNTAATQTRFTPNTQIRINMSHLKPKRYRSNRHALALVRAVYAGTAIRKRLGPVKSTYELRAIGISPDGRFKRGDIIFFKRSPDVPEIGVIKKRLSDGTLLALASTRGKLRDIRLNLNHRSTRRKRGRIINSFIRVKRPGDRPRTVYLAGQLVTDIRRLLDTD